MRLIVGLGNPGLKFKLTRHNLGFLVIDKLSRKNSIRLNKRKRNSLFGRGRIGVQEVILAKPLTYMNLSGEAVGNIIAREGLSPERMMVVCDDVNLELGAIRIRPHGSSGGHNGLRSIVEALGTREFPRLRMGIGGTKKGDLTQYVLGPFRKKDLKLIEALVGRTIEALDCWLSSGIKVSMNKFNT